MEGYDAKFDPPLDKRLECPICLLAQRDPLQTPCGHRFCASCILRALRETGPRCPVDNTRVSNHNLFRDNFAKREVLSLKVKCAAVDLGCTWKGELRDLESHLLMCDLVCIDCPNCCGHSCQRKDLNPHIAMCSNKPEQCPTCSIHFTRDKVQLHLPQCSSIVLPESILSNLFKANEVLKWTGHIKLKVNKRHISLLNQLGTNCQVSSYLTAKMDTPESRMFCGNWLNQLSLSTLDSQCAKVFMRTLQGPEVQMKSFTFNLLCNDSRGNLVSRMLKKKINDISALLGLNLMANVSRSDLTVMYIHWSEPKKKIVALVAELKAHLVKQMQSRLQSVQGSNSRRNRAMPPHPPPNRVHHHNPAYHIPEYAFHRHRQHQHSQAPPPPPGAGPPGPPGSHQAPHPHLQPSGPPSHMQQQHHHHHPMHTHMHPMGIVTQGPPPPNSHSRQHHQLQQQQQQQHQSQQTYHHPLHSSQLYQERSAQSYPRILSYQMSRSLSGYPWRVQHENVPFFTFPSTPPSFLPANHYPYTFAPPISINQIAPGPAPVPSYAGIPVPNVTGVDSVVSGPVGTTFPMAALTSLTEIPREHLHNVPPGAVAVTIASGSHPVTRQTVVIQQPMVQQQTQEPGMQNQDVAVFQAISHQPPPPHHPIHMHHGHAQYTPAQHIGPTIIARGDGGPQQGPSVLQPGPNVIQPGPSVIQHGPLVAAAVPPPHLISVAGGPHHGSVMGVSLAHSVPSSDPSQSQVSWRQDAVAVNPEHRRARSMSSEHSNRLGSTSQYPSSLAQTDGESSGLPSSRRTRSSNNATISLITDEPGPSRINPDPASPSDNDSLDSDSPGTQLSSMLYRRRHFAAYDHDSDDSSAVDLDSGDSIPYQHDRQLSDSSGEGHIMTSDGDDSSGLSDSESDEVTNPSTLRMINSNSAVVNVRPSPDVINEGPSSSEVQPGPSVYVLSESNPGDEVDMERPSSDHENLNLPPLINISSDSEMPIARAQTPPSIIDLTVSSANSSPNMSEVNASTHRHSSTSSDPRVFRDPSTRVISTNLFNGEPSGEVVMVPAIHQHPHQHQHQHQHAVGGDIEESALSRSNANSSFVITSNPEMARVVGVVATSQSHDFHHGSHSVVQLAQPHSHQHFFALPSQQQQQQQAQPRQPQHTHHHAPAMLQAHASRHGHPRSSEQPPTAAASQSMFQFPQHVAHGSESGGVAMQQVSALPPPGATVPVTATAVQLDPGLSGNPHGVHVLTWQQRLPAGELVPSHTLQPRAAAAVASAVVLPPPPTGQPLTDAVLASHHHMQAEADAVAAAAVLGLQQQQAAPPPPVAEGGAAAAAGNFWETVMPSLDLSLQGNMSVSAESSTHQ